MEKITEFATTSAHYVGAPEEFRCAILQVLAVDVRSKAKTEAQEKKLSQLRFEHVIIQYRVANDEVQIHGIELFKNRENLN